ncbi:MAG: FlgO family outer membrane protein [Deltaproteobacteria bacterium]|nr:FlgO family outer membrane protein [Deltaproteobacteria bacterium]
MNRVTALLTLLLGIFIYCAPVSADHLQIVGDRDEVYKLGEGRRYMVHEPLPGHQSRTAVGNFNSMMIFMADQLERNVDRKILGNAFIVSTFSNLNKLSESSPLGRLVGENIIHEMQVRKWNVFDLRLTRDIIINEAGEFSLSRDIKKLRDTYKIGGIITGTYSIADDSIIINARVIDIDTGLIFSTAQVHIPVNNFTEALLFDVEKLKPMKIVGN